MNELAALNAALEQATRQQVEAARQRHDAGVEGRTRDPLSALHARIEAELSELAGKPVSAEVSLVERERFKADLNVKVPALLSELSARGYIKEFVPKLVALFRSEAYADIIERVDARGLFVNLKLHDTWLTQALADALSQGEQLGRSANNRERVVVIDYSSPNVAKVLHAGHIRSTILGHVIGNLYEATGALVHRVNHINDFGGFGFFLEGYRRFEGLLADIPELGTQLTTLYGLRRALEKAVGAGQALSDLSEEAQALVARALPGVETAEQLAAAWQDYVQASDARFQALERGDADEVGLWQRMVQASLADFQGFYDALGIHLDHVLGESFYFQEGDRIIDECLADGRMLQFGPEHLAVAAAELDAKVAAGELEADDARIQKSYIEKDLGAVVVPLSTGERLVVRRADGRSIYATRDLGAISLRGSIFGPTDVLYVVGQEQRVHFQRLFDAARTLGLVTDETLEHVYFGFYVNASTRQKLSSRDSASGVHELLSRSYDYFYKRTQDKRGEDEALSHEQLDRAATQLSVGSLVFNDLKQDIKGSVLVETGDLEQTIQGFEKSGGAYVVYSALRARSVLRKLGTELPAFPTDLALGEAEMPLAKKALQFPAHVLRAANTNNPVVLVRYLLELAAAFNSYYANRDNRVLTEDGPVLEKLLITAVVARVLENGLALVHVECPEVI